MDGRLKQYFQDRTDNVCAGCVVNWDLWLGEVAKPGERKRIESSLKNVGDTAFYSAHLELWLHHQFLASGQTPEWHPDLPSSDSHPDLLVQASHQDFYCEARISKQEREFTEQDLFCRRLQTELERIKLPYLVDFFVDEPAPPLAGFDEMKQGIVAYVSDQLKGFRDHSPYNTYERFPLRGSRYGINFSFTPLDDSLRGNVLANYSVGGFSRMREKLRGNIAEKATRYGKLSGPLVTVLWGLDQPTEVDEVDVLYGSTSVQLRRDVDGTVIEPLKPTRQRDGVFTLRDGGRPKYAGLSAVAFYQYQYAEKCHKHDLRIYHNPFAAHPLKQSVFGHYAQMVPVEDQNGGGQMNWISSP